MADALIQYALATGLDTRTDAHSQELGALEQAVNVVFDKMGAVRKRHGNVSQGNVVVPGTLYAGPAGTGVQLGVLPVAPSGLIARGGEQSIVAGNRLFTYSPTGGFHVSKDQIAEAVGTRRPLHGSQASAFGGVAVTAAYNPDVCQTSEGFRVFVWTSQRGAGRVFFSVHDTTSPNLTQVFAPTADLTSVAGVTTAGRPIAIALGAAVVLFYADMSNGDIWATTIVRTGSGWGVGPTTKLFAATLASTSPPTPFDVTTDDGVHFIIACQGASTTQLRVARFSPDLGLTGTYTASWNNQYTTDATATTAISVCMNTSTLFSPNPHVWVTWLNGTAPLRLLVLVASTGATFTGSTSISLGGVSMGSYLASLPLPNDGTVDYVRVVLDAISTSGGIRTIALDNNGSIHRTSSNPGIALVQPQSRPFVVGAKTYLLGWIPSQLQGGYVWVDINAENGNVTPVNTGTAGPRAVASIAPRQASTSAALNASANWSNGVRQYGTMSSVIASGGTLFATPIGVVVGGSLPGSPNTLSLWETRLDFAHPNIGKSATLGRQTIVAQGIYDGSQVSEFGFISYPEQYTATGGGGTHTYQYAVIWEWETDAGELAQSTTQAARNGQVVTILNTPDPPNSTINLLGAVSISSQPNLTTKFDQENGYTTPAQLALYRSQDGSPFTRVAGIAPSGFGPLYPASYTDTATQASIAGNAQLYFSPGVAGSPLDNVAPPSSSCTTTGLNRIWLIGDDLRTVWFSQSYVEGFQPGFNEVLTMQIEDGGDLVAIGFLNQNTVIFSATRIYMTNGTGPDTTGSSPFPQPQVVQSDVGCIDCRSVVAFPDGLLFLSKQGLCVLGQDFSVNYLDAPEDILAAYPNIKSAVLVPEHHEIRLALDNGATGILLVLNYWGPERPYKYKWSTFAIYDNAGSVSNAIVSAAGYVNGYRWASSGGNPYTEDTTGATYFDGPAGASTSPQPPGTTPWVTMLVQTSWIAANGIVGYQRGKRIGLIGDWYTSHDLQVSVATDFNPSIAISAPTGQTHTFSSDFAQGGPLDRFITHVKNQKHQALQITIQDAYPTGLRAVVGSGQGFSLAGLALLADVKKGLGKLLADNRSA